jgi:polysaccharide pyruvyl transferase WcaK-like protein
MKRLYSKLTDSTKVTLDETLYNHNQLWSLMQHFNFTINFKLHANYISLVANTPFIALGYRFKIFDFVKSAKLEDYIIATDEKAICERILTLEESIIYHYSSIKIKMKIMLTYYRGKIIKPFEKGLYL